MKRDNLVIEVGDIWYTPCYGGDTEFYELILDDLGNGTFVVLNLLTGDAYDAGCNVFYQAAKVA